MKKLVFALAAAMAIGVQAASIDWATGVFTTESGASSDTLGKSTDVFQAMVYVYSDAAGENLLGSGSTTTMKKSGYMVGTVDDLNAPADGVTQTYYTKMVIKEISTGKELESTMGSFTWTGGDLASPDLTFYGDVSGFASGGSPSASASGWATPGSGGGGGGSGGVPEPTSGLLLLVGGAMLALRRKQK